MWLVTTMSWSTYINIEINGFNHRDVLQTPSLSEPPMGIGRS